MGATLSSGTDEKWENFWDTHTSTPFVVIVCMFGLGFHFLVLGTKEERPTRD
jgi:hypothetical protein